ncbi:hypothetical protein ADUPG1_002263, partial [Aduncisulcus paluster]
MEKGICLEHVRDNANLHLFTDASDVGVGGALVQFEKDDVELKKPGVICFVSKSLTKQEAKHTTTAKEAYAIFYCISKCEYYLRGREFTLHTDHQNLLYVKTTSSAKVERWRTYLSDFTFKTVHIKGELNKLADALSRVGHVVDETVPVIPNHEHEAELLKWRRLNIEARGTPMKPSKKCPVIRDIENKYAKKSSASTLRVAYAKETPGVSVKRKVITNRQREQWLKKVKASQMKYLSDTDKKNVVKGLVMWKECVVIPEDDDDLVKEVLSDAHNNA